MKKGILFFMLLGFFALSTVATAADYSGISAASGKVDSYNSIGLFFYGSANAPLLILPSPPSGLKIFCGAESIDDSAPTGFGYYPFMYTPKKNNLHLCVCVKASGYSSKTSILAVFPGSWANGDELAPADADNEECIDELKAKVTEEMQKFLSQ